MFNQKFDILASIEIWNIFQHDFGHGYFSASHFDFRA